MHRSRRKSAVFYIMRLYKTSLVFRDGLDYENLCEQLLIVLHNMSRSQDVIHSLLRTRTYDTI